MKRLVLALALTALVPRAPAAGNPELDAARQRYEAALAAATKPVRERYASELQQLKNRAMTLKNLELAVAIDRELKALGVAVAGAATPEPRVATTRLAVLLPGSQWEPENDAGYYQSIAFTADGFIVRKPKSGEATREAYEIEKDGDTVSFKRFDGARLRLHFSPNRRTFEMNNITYRRTQP